ncbi:MAG: hypothetical protein IJ158_09240 [Treponema sp.]|nr:hypothetical protein [Treponema sp.]
MYYILGFIAFLLLALGIFLMVSKNRKVTIGFICVALAICTFVAIPIIAVHSFLFSPAKTESKKEIVRLTLQDFSTAYAQSAPLFGAQSGFVLNIESGEKADIAKAKINDISSINISLEKTSEKKLLGVMIFVGNSNDSVKMWEALSATYAIVKIFETDRSAESIPEFVQKLLNMDSGGSTNGSNVIYTVNQALGNTILSIRYPTE